MIYLAIILISLSVGCTLGVGIMALLSANAFNKGKKEGILQAKGENKWK